MITSSLRKRFVKDYNLPITILQDPYFIYFIDLLSHMNARERYDEFVDLVERLGGEEQFFAESKRIIESIIDYVKSKSEYNEYSNYDLSNYTLSHNFKEANSIFNKENHNKWFTSVDLVKANWQSFNYFMPGLVDFSPSYEEWVKRFTNESYYLKSKQIRQVVFGKLNPKRQQKIQRFMMDQVWNLMDNASIPVVGATSDELIVTHGDSEKYTEEEIRKNLPVSFNMHVKTYKLVRIGDKPFYKREYLDGSFDIKGVPSYYYPEVLKQVLNEEVNEFDRTYYFEGRLARFFEPLF